MALFLAGCPSAADMADEAGEVESGTTAPAPERRDREQIHENLKRLQREREQLDELKRTQHPFYSERELRQRLQQNEAEQRWYRHEQDRLEVERRRAEDRARQLQRR